MPPFVNEMNALGRKSEPFVFIIDFKAVNCILFSELASTDALVWQIGEKPESVQNGSRLKTEMWQTIPVSFEKYKAGYDLIQNHISNGDTYLLNYTQPTEIKTNLTLEEIYRNSSAPYKIYLKERFVCFSPETFVQIKQGKIFSYPMKGTIDANIPNAEEILENDEKEVAEHSTIVDLIRNDLSLVSENVKVDKFRYLTHIQTNNKNLWQVSSQISGDLPADYKSRLGDILYKMLPAGSISGAPKKKTLEIIEKAEGYERGFYTGIFGYFDGNKLDSCVLIRFVENIDGQLFYKSGGGITSMSDARNEYDEMLKKVYVPIT